MTTDQIKKNLEEMIAHAVFQAVSDPINADMWTAFRTSLQDAENQLQSMGKPKPKAPPKADQLTARMFCICVKVSKVDPQKRESLYPNDMQELIGKTFKLVKDYCKETVGRDLNWCKLSFSTGHGDLMIMSNGADKWNELTFGAWASKLQKYSVNNNKPVESMYFYVRFAPDETFDTDKSPEALNKFMALETGFDSWFDKNTDH
jgi:hypothetical protein